MATRYKILGQSAPSATTNTDLYTVPALKETIVSTIVIANRSDLLTAYRVAVLPSGGSLGNEHYIAFDVNVGISDSTTMTLGITLTAGDKIIVRTATANVSFSAFGSEIDL
jgi:hypothetical protein